MQKLESLLPPRPKVEVPKHGDLEEVTLSEFDERRYERMGGGGGRREAYHDDDDDSDDEMGGHPGGAQHVQCAQQ